MAQLQKRPPGQSPSYAPGLRCFSGTLLTQKPSWYLQRPASAHAVDSAQSLSAPGLQVGGVSMPNLLMQRPFFWQASLAAQWASSPGAQVGMGKKLTSCSAHLPSTSQARDAAQCASLTATQWGPDGPAGYKPHSPSVLQLSEARQSAALPALQVAESGTNVHLPSVLQPAEALQSEALVATHLSPFVVHRPDSAHAEEVVQGSTESATSATSVASVSGVVLAMARESAACSIDISLPIATPIPFWECVDDAPANRIFIVRAASTRPQAGTGGCRPSPNSSSTKRSRPIFSTG